MKLEWVAATVLGVLVAGCGGPDLRSGEAAPEPVRSWGTGAPGVWAASAVDVTAPSGGAVRVAAGLNNRGELLVTTWGSSTCPRLPESVEAQGSSVVVETKEFHLFEGDGCTSDASPTTGVVPVPSGITVGRTLQVVIDGTPVIAHHV